MSWFQALSCGKTWQPPMTGAVTFPPGVVGVAVGVGVGVFGRVGVAVGGTAVLVGVAVAGAVVRVGVGVLMVLQVATISLFETRDVVMRLPSQCSRMLSPGCSVVEDEAAKTESAPRPSTSARPTAPGSNCRFMRKRLLFAEDLPVGEESLAQSTLAGRRSSAFQ